MRLRVAALFLGSVVAGLVVGTHPAAQATEAVSILRATPYKGHIGDTIDLSGSGFPPHERLYVMMACPNWHTKSAFDYGNIRIIPQDQGPITDANGEFGGYLMRALQLRGAPASGCQIYTSAGGTDPYGPAFPAQYFIVPRSQKLPACVQHMCLKVRPSPTRVHAGVSESIGLSGWPGAQVDLSVSYAGNTQHRTTVLDWKGKRTVKVPLTTQVSQPTVASVRVRARIERQDANLTTQFVVVH